MTREETEQHGNQAAGGCVLTLLATVTTAAVFRASLTAGTLAVWTAGLITLWRTTRRRMSDSSATPPPGPTTPLGSEEAGHSDTDGTTLVHREGMLIYLTPDPDNPHRTTVHVHTEEANSE
ncbi:hypothetical protein [Streptomyces sp. MUM 16J]|uniref:hypothetical protein n=1 Tax=Streptomyces sp. MUM 16J TaxID=2791988 RepID=UPI001F048518|nr:hypothetical protein [Streptomyces sp. MUM 16J]MCH0555800.1 hypothetical protein [Streptomyces sp. MUM 16J]